MDSPQGRGDEGGGVTIDLPTRLLPVLQAINLGEIFQSERTGKWTYRGQPIEITNLVIDGSMSGT